KRRKAHCNSRRSFRSLPGLIVSAWLRTLTVAPVASCSSRSIRSLSSEISQHAEHSQCLYVSTECGMWIYVMPTLTRILITLCVGVAASQAWQSYGDAARQIIASAYPQAGWLAPRTVPIGYSAPSTTGLLAQTGPSLDQLRLNAISLDLDA